ncbi:tropomyosin-related protein [Artemisia annua]|uniref:Tropomyosin-related protein n=1 Tax=Artemisia annua TaxID=35608 RepID=A0A2U1MYF2_ARTAN|nr:tropomyosin-related protein [Artemisia annua]
MSDEAPPAANGAASDLDIEITSTEHASDEAAVNQKLISKISLLEQDLVNEKVKLKHLEDEVSGHESDKRALSSIAARASELETQVSRLQHDLISSMSDGQEANAEVSNLKRKGRENEAKLSVIENERNLLLEKVKESEERFNESESEKARKIEVLGNKISEFEAKERENAEKIEALVEKLRVSEAKEREKADKVDTLMEKLKESENKISELENEAKNKNLKVNEMQEKLDQLQQEIVSKENVVESTKNGIVSKVDWPVVAVSAGAVVTLGLVYFRHAKF